MAKACCAPEVTMTSLADTVAPRARRRAAIHPRSRSRPSGQAYCNALACGSRIARTKARAKAARGNSSSAGKPPPRLITPRRLAAIRCSVSIRFSTYTIGRHGGLDSKMTATGVPRDPLDELVRYNRQFVGDGRDPQWLRLKLDRLCASPFGFLRGTFHLFAADWALFGDDPLAGGADQPIVGDLHVENFGAFRAADGSVVFDVNDFDETALSTPAFDLARLAVSIVVADERHGDGRAVERIGALVDAWANAARSCDLRPIGGRDAPPLVRALVDAASDSSRARWLDRRVACAQGQRRFKSSEKYRPVADEAQRSRVTQALHAFGAQCSERPRESGDWPQVLDIAVRVAGTGSLGRLRWVALTQGKHEEPGKERILELKEALPSALSPGEAVADRADRVIATQRRLQGAPPAYLGSARVAGRSFTVRELQPTEAKLDVGALKGGDLDAVAAACGDVLGRLHARAGAELAARIVGRERAIRRRVAAFALRCSEQVLADHARLRAERSAVAQRLNLPVAGNSL